MRVNALTSGGQRDVHHAVLIQELLHHVGQVVLIVVPFKAITLINLMLPSDIGHAVSNSFPFPIFRDRVERTNSELGTGLWPRDRIKTGDSFEPRRAPFRKFPMCIKTHRK